MNDQESNEILHITKDGKLKSSFEYKESPLYATMFGSDVIAISTIKGVNFHRLSIQNPNTNQSLF